MQENQKIGRLEIIQWKVGVDSNGNFKVIPYIKNKDNTKKLILTTGKVLNISDSILVNFNLKKTSVELDIFYETFSFGDNRKLCICINSKLISIYKTETPNQVLTLSDINEIKNKAEKILNEKIKVLLEKKELKRQQRKESAKEKKIREILEAQDESQNF